MNNLSKKDTITIGLMLFSLFFGAGNLIFPPALGQAAGTNLTEALIGFILTAVGLPLLGVAAIAVSGNLETLTNRVHPVFALVFSTAIYLSIGPLLAIPRAASVAFEMGASPFLPDGAKAGGISLFLYTLLFFATVFWFCLHPAKLVDRFGKMLTPTLLLLIAAIFLGSMVNPLGEFASPAEAYENGPVFKGFLEGYLTMDALASLAYGIVIISAIEQRGIKEPKKLAFNTIKAGAIAGVCLGAIYVVLGYLGASSQSLPGSAENGGQILTAVVTHLFGKPGTVLLGAVFTLACFATSVGLVTSCSQYFSKIIPAVPYKAWIFILCVFSMAVANLGLTQIISISVPILIAIYPLAIILILLSFFHYAFKGCSYVYRGSLLATSCVSIADSFKQIGVELEWLTAMYSHLPMYAEGIGWILPAAAGAAAGYLWGAIKAVNTRSLQVEKRG